MARLANVAVLLAILLVACDDFEQSTADQPATTRASTTTTVPGIGDPVRDGSFEFVVHYVGEPETPPDTWEEPLGVWVVVDLSVKNVKDSPQTFGAYNQKLIVREAEYEAAFAVDGSVSINPGLGTTSRILFDVPPSVLSARSAQVELHDSMFSGGVTVTVTPEWIEFTTQASTDTKPPSATSHAPVTTLSDADTFEAMMAFHRVLGFYPLDVLYEVADGACAAWDDGAGWEEIALTTYEVSPADWDYGTVGYFLA